MNRPRAEAAYFAESLAELERALGHLEYSAETCQSIVPARMAVDENQLIQIEAFTSRFARVVDLLSKRVLRAIDQFEMHEPGTLLDVANRAAKRGLIDSVDWLRDIKEARNQISHDYAGERLMDVLTYCRQELPKLMDACNRTLAYGREVLNRQAGNRKFEG